MGEVEKMLCHAKSRDFSPRFFCNDAALLCEFQSDKI